MSDTALSELQSVAVKWDAQTIHRESYGSQNRRIDRTSRFNPFVSGATPLNEQSCKKPSVSLLSKLFSVNVMTASEPVAYKGLNIFTEPKATSAATVTDCSCAQKAGFAEFGGDPKAELTFATFKRSVASFLLSFEEPQK